MLRIAMRIGRRVVFIAIAYAFVAFVTNVLGPPTVAQAAPVSADFRIALEPFGAWRHSNRFGDVWVPVNRARDWRPYTVGHWIYTDDFGWYWVADDQEADWGWITYHYGHWYLDREFGWIWVPGDVWAPAWVAWRSGDEYVGWAPDPPDEVIASVDDDPAYWCFVGTPDLFAPSIVAVILPATRVVEVFRRTELVNRTVLLRGPGQHFAVNPGIPSSFVASASGRPIRSFQVRPRVLAGTAGVPGAVQVRAQDLRRPSGNRPSGRAATRDIVQRSSTIIRPTRSAQPPQALARGEQGRLGGTPPRAARGLTVEQRAVQGAASQRSAQSPPQQPRRSEQRGGTAQTAPITPPPRTAETPPQRRESTAAQQQRTGPGVAPQRPPQRGPIASAPEQPIRPPPAPAARSHPVAPPAVAARPAPPPPRAMAAPPVRQAPPRIVAAPPPRPAAPPPRAMAAPPPRPAPPPRAMAAPPPPAMTRAAPPPAAPRPAPPVTMGAAPRGGPPPGPPRRPH